MTLALAAFALLFAGMIATSFRLRARPREIILRLGRRQGYPDAPAYQVLHGGGWVFPVLERAERLELGPHEVRVELERVLVRDQLVDARFSANVSFHAARPELLRFGIEWLLGKSPQQVREIVAIVAGGKLFGALASLGVPESEGDLDRIRADVYFEVAALLDTIGLELEQGSIAIEVRPAVEP